MNERGRIAGRGMAKKIAATAVVQHVPDMTRCCDVAHETLPNLPTVTLDGTPL